jgi:hypothetical protein
MGSAVCIGRAGRRRASPDISESVDWSCVVSSRSSGLLPRDYFDADRFSADERGLSKRGPYASAANAARRKARGAVDAALAARATDAGRSDFSGLVDRGTENAATGHDRPTRRGGHRCFVLVRK